MPLSKVPYVRLADPVVLDSLRRHIARLTIQHPQYQTFIHQAQFLVQSLRLGSYNGRPIVHHPGVLLDELVARVDKEFGFNFIGTKSLHDMFLERVSCFYLNQKLFRAKGCCPKVSILQVTDSFARLHSPWNAFLFFRHGSWYTRTPFPR